MSDYGYFSTQHFPNIIHKLDPCLISIWFCFCIKIINKPLNITGLKNLIKYYIVHKDFVPERSTQKCWNGKGLKQAYLYRGPTQTARFLLHFWYSFLSDPQGKTSHDQYLQEEFTVNIYCTLEGKRRRAQITFTPTPQLLKALSFKIFLFSTMSFVSSFVMAGQ